MQSWRMLVRVPRVQVPRRTRKARASRSVACLHNCMHSKEYRNAAGQSHRMHSIVSHTMGARRLLRLAAVQKVSL